MKAAKIRVLIVDDHRLVRAGIASLLGSERDICIVGQAANGREGLEMTRSLKPDVVLMDINMPGFDGIQATAEIVRELLSTKILMLTQYDQEEYIKRGLQAGASGYLLKNSLVEELPKAIHAVQRNERYLPPVVSNIVAQSYFSDSRKRDGGKAFKALTGREQEILKGIAEGLSNQEIAARLFISVRTVEFHRSNVFEKLGVRDTVSLVKYAILHKIITLE